MRLLPSVALLFLFAASTVVNSTSAAPPAGCTANGTTGELTWWYESTIHGRGYRNVRDWGAKGDGIADDTTAILAALTTGRQPVYQVSNPTAVYFPPGTYLISASIPLYFYTFLSGSPCAPSIIKFVDNANFQGYMIDADFGQGEWGDDDDQFYRGISHLTITMGAGNPSATGIHWAQSQAAHLRSVVIDMSLSGKAGLFGENGSGGFMDGVTVIGGTIP
jgi:glucan 1,3-beta-glucosidase